MATYDRFIQRKTWALGTGLTPSTIPGVRGNVTRSHQSLEAESHFLLPFPFSYTELEVLAQDCRDPGMSGQRGIFTPQLMLESPVSGGEVGNEAC